MITTAQGPSPIRVALIGGGLGGLTFANALLKLREEDSSPPLELTVYEGARVFSEIGAGIGMGQNAFDVMCYLGLEKEYMAIADPCELCQWRYGEADRPQGVANKLSDEKLLHSTVHRADLLDVLAKNVPKEITEFGKRLVSYSQADEKSAITLHFSDGTTRDCDVLVGGDGVKSVVREQLYASEKGFDASPVYTGTTAARGLLPASTVAEIVGTEEATRPQMYLGLDQHLLIFPIQGGKVTNVVAFKTDRSVPNPVWNGGPGVAPIASEDLLKDWSHWSEKTQSVLKAIKAPSQWALMELPDLPYHAKGSVCLMGDASHASLPHQGAGAGQALEDGVVLAALLTSPLTTASNIPTTLSAYNTLRRERSTGVKNTSHELGDIIEFAHPSYKDDKEKIVGTLKVRYDWIWEWEAEKEVVKAREVLEDLVNKA
ncbi:FAD/NAD-P-binding domain-containing protein [Pseudohyphozyma bogoriensis]|nr:FAD/NAD-P-binding domain-containing protein [Pseudohyphozyma bogoriensis]